MTKFPKCLEMPNFYERVRLCKKYGIIYVRGGRLKQRISLQFIEQALTLAENKGIKLGKDIGARAIGKTFLDHWEVLRVLDKEEIWRRLNAELMK